MILVPTLRARLQIRAAERHPMHANAEHWHDIQLDLCKTQSAEHRHDIR